MPQILSEKQISSKSLVKNKTLQNSDFQEYVWIDP